MPIDTKSVRSENELCCFCSGFSFKSNIKGKYNKRLQSILNLSIKILSSASDIINERSLLYMLAISRLAISFKSKSFADPDEELIDCCLVFRRKCKSSVSRILRASGQFSVIRQPNCSSVIKRSKRTTSGFKSLTKKSKLEWFNKISTT